MIVLEKTHDPRKNSKILKELNKKNSISISEAIKTTENLFREISLHTAKKRPKDSITDWLKFIIKKAVIQRSKYVQEESTRICMDENENVYPDWKIKLDREYQRLKDEAKEEVNVKDFGAVGDGVTDDTQAFVKAISNGRVNVRVPAGTYVTKGVKIPSWTALIGEGKGVTTLKLHDKAPKGEWLVTNKNHFGGNRNILVKGMSLDWNIERLGNEEKTSAGNNRSSCLTFANVTYGWMMDLEGINPGLHCFDVSSSLYTYLGDGTRSRGGSSYIWLDHLNGHGFGDDGITTHHSENIFISNSHMCDPCGRSHKHGFSNSNGIEIDDGSRNVWLWNNSTSHCFGGLEIKAHHTASAASNVHIVGHLSVNDNRAYNFRHIGHHKETDPVSKTAFHISATAIYAIAPIFTGLYKDSTPRGLVISGYDHAVINHFTLIGDTSYDYMKNPVVAIQYRARNIVLNNISIKDFKTASAAIKVFGGRNGAEDVVIRNITCDHYLSKPVLIGSDATNIVTENIMVLNQEKETSIT